MALDIRSLFIATTIVVFVNALISALAWYYAKSLRSIIGWWSLNWLLAGIGILLIALRHTVSDFFSIIVANACILGGQIAIQEGIARYMGKEGYLRRVTLYIWLVMIAGFIYLTYVQPSVNNRVMIFSIVTMMMSIVSLNTLATTEEKGAPHRLLVTILLFQMVVIAYRGILAVFQESQVDFLSSGILHAVGVVGILMVYSGLSLCFFWIVAYQLGLNIQKEAFTDSLTGLSNRRAMDRMVERLQVGPANNAIGFLLIDIDRFKEINDRFGHQAGDQYLIGLGRKLSQNLREGDAVFRYAGDEFFVLVQNCDESNVLNAAERLRKNIAELEVIWGNHKLCSTVSIGIALSNDELRNSSDLMRIADEALYRAKNDGGNCVIVA